MGHSIRAQTVSFSLASRLLECPPFHCSLGELSVGVRGRRVRGWPPLRPPASGSLEQIRRRAGWFKPQLLGFARVGLAERWINQETVDAKGPRRVGGAPGRFSAVTYGEAIGWVSEILGHSDIKMTTRYAHLRSAHLWGAVERLEGLTRAHVTPPILAHGDRELAHGLAHEPLPVDAGLVPQQNHRRAPVAQLDRARVS